MNAQVARALERLLWQDPGGRGPAQAAATGRLPAAGHLAQAARSLQQARGVLIFTGFPVLCPTSAQVKAETDGPPAALLLAWSLQRQGAWVRVVVDPWAAQCVRLGAAMLGLEPEVLWVFSPAGNPRTENQPHFPVLKNPANGPPTHLVAIERPGPSHHRESLTGWGLSPEEQHRWLSNQGPGGQDHCFNMRGESIHRWSASLARVFEHFSRSIPGVETIGIWDGGNELGAGAFHPRLLAQVVRGPFPARIVSRIGCRYSVVCGTSNWGGYALAAWLALGCGAWLA